jgi:pimeloyl-ACP methyl ester carboxylesterase
MPGIVHGMADIQLGPRLHFVTAGDGPPTIVLLHGFPQTWREWRHVIPPLVAAGFASSLSITAEPETPGARPRVTTSVRDVPEMLVAGRERQYLQSFFNARVFDPSAISESDLDAYAAPGAMRAGFEVCRAFDQDIKDNRDALERNGKPTIPVLAMGGTASTTGPLMEAMMREAADDGTPDRIQNAGHWIAEENPSMFLSELLKFLGK